MGTGGGAVIAGVIIASRPQGYVVYPRLLLGIVRHQRSLDRTGGLNKGEFLAHRNVHRSEDETANPTIEGTG